MAQTPVRPSSIALQMKRRSRKCVRAQDANENNESILFM